MNPGTDIHVTQVEFETAESVSRDLQTRIRNALQRAGIMTLEQLLTYSRKDLKRSRCGLGTTCIGGIEAKLADMGLRLSEHDRT